MLFNVENVKKLIDCNNECRTVRLDDVKLSLNVFEDGHSKVFVSAKVPNFSLTIGGFDNVSLEDFFEFQKEYLEFCKSDDYDYKYSLDFSICYREY